jgi:hypothetical protein
MAPEIQDYPKQANNGNYYINISSNNISSKSINNHSNSNQTNTQSKLELPWLMISLHLIMSRVVMYKIKWHEN